jgi:hypothetical protein
MQEGVVATSYAAGDKFYIDPMKLLPMERFLPQPKGAPSRGGAPPAHCLFARCDASAIPFREASAWLASTLPCVVLTQGPEGADACGAWLASLFRTLHAVCRHAEAGRASQPVCALVLQQRP